MSIIIENPTAEAIYAAIKSQIPPSEFERLKHLLSHEESSEQEEAAWRAASAHSAARFIDEEES